MRSCRHANAGCWCAGWWGSSTPGRSENRSGCHGRRWTAGSGRGGPQLARLRTTRTPAQGGDPALYAAALAAKTDMLARIAAEQAAEQARFTSTTDTTADTAKDTR